MQRGRWSGIPRAGALARFGTPELREQWAAPAVTGEKILTVALDGEFGQGPVQATACGDGFKLTGIPGSQAPDEIFPGGEGPPEALGFHRTTNHAGGIEGGISTGELLVVRAAMKPLATLNVPVLETVDTATKEATVSFKERTDVTAVPAMGVVAETMVALVLAGEAQRKFGGDSVDEFVRNAEAFTASLS